MIKKIFIWIGVLVACWQAAVTTDAPSRKELSSTLSAIHQGVPPFCEEIANSSIIVVSLHNVSFSAIVGACTSRIFVKWLLCETVILDFNRTLFVSIFLFPFHSFF